MNKLYNLRNIAYVLVKHQKLINQHDNVHIQLNILIRNIKFLIYLRKLYIFSN